MKILFTSIFAFLVMGFIPFNSLNAQTTFEFCGSTFTVNCDGTVDVDLADNVDIYKIWNGDQLVAELNNYRSDRPNVIYSPFNSADPGFGNPIPDGQNFYLDIQTTDCGDFTLNISKVLAENCSSASGFFEFCGSTFNINCDGTVDVDLATNVDIYKVWNGGSLVVELNNYNNSIPNVVYNPFNSGLVGGIIPPGENYYLDIQTTDCGDFTLNISKWLEMNCSAQGYRKAAEKEILDITAYPNPTNSEVNLELPVIDDQYIINVYDLGGKLVKELTSEGGNTTIDMSAFNTGLYVLRVQSNEYTYTEKIQVLK